MRTTSSGVDGRSRRRRSSAKPAAASGNACAGVQTEPGAAVSVPDPTTIASAHARRSAITKRSAALSAAISLFEEGSDGTATTPSIVATKFANSLGSSKPSEPPYSAARSPGRSKATRPSGS